MKNNSWLTEVCCYTLAEVQAAQDSGAERIELCADRSAGGTTPSAGIIAEARRIFKGKLMVMVRPREGNFVYSEAEIFAMKRDISIAERAGADGIVLGLLKNDRAVDVEKTTELVRVAGTMDITFHRAVDETADWEQAFGDILRCGIHRVLTSGGKPNVTEGRDELARMVKWNSRKMKILAGGGVSAPNAISLWEAGIREYHFTAFTQRDIAKAHPTMFPDRFAPDPDKILSIRRQLKEISSKD